ncbi:ABC transporter [Candidatus Collierbacteria bacterium CG17_big_fil_post_rev_8_21_14_2_50_45_7]|uniref:ABC transporter n=1 Tax=Candidatus Collierbacteria bacterium CG17_big_fil_post_rev_8_21_14_2_50_45_7 TaxID=1974536 RepID=A0A2M7FRV1_9BACT|nr:MAG: ABC transporter [Candidatus Collierbacteria bacterium CG17_big_fil_post_rev_8_21_14_2_50_45_7]
MTYTILANNLSKIYSVQKKRPGLSGSLQDLFSPIHEQKQAVKNVSFVIDEGELVGFIGPNGAGKTTTLKMLSGLLYPSAGSVRVLGFDPWKRQYDFLRQISLVMGQKNQLWWDLPAIESFNLARDIYDIPSSVYKKMLNQLVEMLDIGDVLNVQVRKLSLGQRMKAELVAALIHSPKILFLDEPTIGLDVLMQQSMRSFLKEYNQNSTGSIVLTSHYMDDVKELCKRVIIIDQGGIIYDGLLSDVIAKFSQHKIIEVITSSGTTTHKVLRGKVAQKAAELLKDPSVIDINIKEVEIEDVIRQVFSNK